jgi:LDH2 family malate/lactate/ureidoglycolate dehydrogenase
MATTKENMVRVPQQVLRAFAETAFQRTGVPEDDARRAANTLIEADLRGIDSHGISRLDRFYLQGLQSGRINTRADWKVAQETATTARIDADRGLGLMVGTHAMEIAIEKAKEYGCGFVTVGNSRHFGASGVYATQPLEHDMIGISMTNTGPIVLPAGGRESRLGTNPIAVAVPVSSGAPFIFDAATSVVSAGKFETYHRQGKRAPEGWAVNDDLEPVTDPARGVTARKILPLGSDLEHSSYKGYGLAMVVDILCGILSGMGPGLSLGGQPGAFQSAHFFGAWRVDAFWDAKQFKEMMTDYLETMRQTPPAPGVDRVMSPGDIEAENKADRLKNGVPLYPDVVENLKDIAQRMEIELKI